MYAAKDGRANYFKKKGVIKVAEKVRVLLTEKEVDDRIQAIGDQISRDYEGKQVHLVCVLKGGSFFMCELAKRITVPVSIDFMSVSSYGCETKSSGVVKIVKDLDEPVMGKDVIVAETAVYYDSDFAVCKQADASYILFLQLSQSGQLLNASMSVTGAGTDSGAGVIYTLTARHHIPRRTDYEER